MKIAVAGTGYVGLSIATLLAQHNEVVAVDVIPEKVTAINNRKSPIRDEYIEKYFSEVGHQFMALSSGKVNATELTAALINQAPDLVTGIRYAQEQIVGSMTILILTSNKLAYKLANYRIF